MYSEAMTNAQREALSSKFRHISGAHLEEDDYALVDGRWYRLLARQSTAPSSWTQKFLGLPKTGDPVELVLKYNDEFYVYTERVI